MTDEPNDKKAGEIEESMEELEQPAAAEEDDVTFDEDSEAGHAEVLKRLRSKLKTAVEEKQAYLNGWQRDKAEFINARKRDEEGKQEFLKFAKTAVIEDILPVLDSFDMAIANGSADQSVSKEWKTGIEGIHAQLVGILAKHDVTTFGAAGDAFDPNLHQSISMVSTDDKSKDHAVAEVLQKGYMIGSKVVRAAMVRVYQA